MEKYPDNVYHPINSNRINFVSHIQSIANKISENDPINAFEWLESIYKPTPTIIEAAQALYKGHSVRDISRSDSGAINLSTTSDNISEIIDHSIKANRKSICFITGVPGAGKH